MEISQKSLGILVDELITTSLKCWAAQESICSETNSETIAIAAKHAQSLNRRRNDLIRAIDAAVGQSDLSPTPKTYR